MTRPHKIARSCCAIILLLGMTWSLLAQDATPDPTATAAPVEVSVDQPAENEKPRNSESKQGEKPTGEMTEEPAGKEAQQPEEIPKKPEDGGEGPKTSAKNETEPSDSGNGDTPAVSAPWGAKQFDWPHWRGPEMNGISRETGIPDSWSPDGENLLWKREDLGTRSTPIAMNGKLYFMCRDNPGTEKEGEKVVCLDQFTGETLWENRYPIYLSDVPDTRVGWSSVTGDPSTGNIFAMSVCGHFQCLNGETGESIWSHSLKEKFGVLDTYGGRTNFPIVYKEVVIISGIVIGWGDMAKPAHRFLGLDKRNGQPIWFTQTRMFPYDTTYSSPVLTTVDGQDAIVFGSGDGGVHAFQPLTGKKIWTYNVSRRGINTTPVVTSNLIICGHSEENLGTNKMGALFALSRDSGEEQWKQMEWMVGKSSPIVVDGRIYAAEDKGTLIVTDAKTGKEITTEKLRGPVRASPLYVDGKIYIITSNSVWWVFKPTEDGLEKIQGGRLNAGEVNASPIVSHGRMYIPTMDALYCIGSSDDVKPQGGERPAHQPLPAPEGDDAVPAQVQIVPAESLLFPTQRQNFEVRLYNARGQFLGMATRPLFSVDAGAISPQGQFASPTSDKHYAATVTAQVGELTGTARIRVVPSLDWQFDFSDGQVPITWVGCRYRHIVVDFNLWQKLKDANPVAADLYIAAMTGFVNLSKETLAYDNSTPKQNWSNLLRFIDRFEAVRTLDDARKTLDPGLDLLKKEGVIADWTWSEAETGGPKLIVNKGERKVDGNGVLMKINTIPKGKRSQGWLGHSQFTDYTFQADVLAHVRDNKMPDIGITAQRYVFDLMGASQQLQIRTWHPQLDRMSENVSFTWEPHKWYTMKFMASHEDGKAILKGKVWPKGEEEPAEWLIEAEDEHGHLIGSPGFMGNAFDTELFYDNISITKNK